MTDQHDTQPTKASRSVRGRLPSGQPNPVDVHLGRRLRLRLSAGRATSPVATLARKAVAGTSFECISPALKGPIVLAFSNDDPGAAARIVKAFAKDNDKLVTTIVSLGGQLLKADSLERVASLPTRAQALSKMLGLLKAPIAKFVGTLAAPNSKLVRTLAAVLEAKKSAEAAVK